MSKKRHPADTPGLGLLWTVMVAATVGACYAHCEEPGATLEVGMGAGIVLSDTSSVVPSARLIVDAPVYLGEESVARVRAALTVNGSSGQELDLSSVRTWNGAELDLELERRIGVGPSTATYIGLGGGGATRRDAAGSTPRERFPGWFSLFAAVEHRESGKAPSRRLKVGIGMSQLCHERATKVPRDGILSGHVDVARVAGGVIRISGDVQRPLWGDGRGVFRLAVTVGV